MAANVVVLLLQNATLFPPSSPPRVVTDLEIIRGKDGVPIDYSYNETARHGEQFARSAPGCPQSIQGFPWIYFGDPKKCFLAGFQGPCKSEEKIVPKFGSDQGACVCECQLRYKDNPQFEGLGRFHFCPHLGPEGHGQIYDMEKDECYNIFEKGSGPCKKESAIITWTKDAVVCHKICDESEDDWKSDLRKGVCSKMPRSKWPAYAIPT